jgi:hypothetical protein
MKKTIFVDTYMGEETLELLFADARDAVREGAQVDIVIETSYAAQPEEFQRLVEVASRTRLPDRVVREVSDKQGEPRYYKRHQLKENLLERDTWVHGGGFSKSQQPYDRVRWNLRLDGIVDAHMLAELLEVFPYYVAENQRFTLHVTGPNATKVTQSWNQLTRNNLRYEFLPELRTD